MKIKKILSLGALAIIGLASSLGLANRDNLAKVSAEEESTTKVTVRWNYEGVEAPETLYCHSWNDGGIVNDTWPGVPTTKVMSGETATYVFDIPNKTSDGSETNRIIFNNGGDPTKTGDLNFNSTLKNLSAHQKGTISFTIEGINSENHQFYGKWYAHTATDFKYTSDYCKIWLDRKELSAASSYCTPVLSYTTTDSKEVSVWPSSYIETYEGSDRYLVGYDVLKNEIIGASYKFSLVDIFWDTSKGETEAKTYISGDNAKLHYFNGFGSSSMNFTLGRAASGTFQLGVANIVKAVFDGYFACSSDKDNGYGNFLVLEDTWIKGKVDDAETWWTQGNMGDVKFNDFASESDYTTGEGKTYATNLYAKYNMMLMGYNSISASPSRALSINLINNSAFMFLVVGSFLAVIVCFATVKIYKFRKR